VFDLILEKQPFITGMKTLEEAVSSFIHLCFVANISYPVGSSVLCSYLQRFAGKLDENGTTAARIKKDLAAKEDKAARSLKKVFEYFKEKMFIILTNK
jgi:hypothetical protein